MAWMVVHTNLETSEKNVVRNGADLTDAEAEQRLAALNKRKPFGHSYAKHEYPDGECAAFMQQHDILEDGAFT